MGGTIRRCDSVCEHSNRDQGVAQEDDAEVNQGIKTSSRLIK